MATKLEELLIEVENANRRVIELAKRLASISQEIAETRDRLIDVEGNAPAVASKTARN